MERIGNNKTNNLIDDKQLLLFWSINDKEDSNEIKRQIAWMHDQGVTGFFFHARAGRVNSYLGNEWERAFSTAVTEAKKYGMYVWLYDEDGWPSGFAGGVVPNASDDFSSKVLGYGMRLPEDAVLLSAYRIEQSGKRIRTDINNADEYLYFEYDKHYSDILYPNAVKCFIDSTHEWYKERFGNEFGKTIKGIFTDEPQFFSNNYIWSKNLADDYQACYGYNILDDAWKLFFPEKDENKEFHFKYRKLLAVLFTNSFTRQISEWCNKNNLLFTGHFPNEDGLYMQIGSCGDVCNNYEYMSLPGIDHLGNRTTSPLLYKQISSIAGQSGKNHMLSETFGCSGWGVTFPELTYIWSCQALHGINVPCLHLSAYSLKGIRKRDYPPFFSYQNIWQNYLGHLSKSIKEISSFLPYKDVTNDVLVISPIEHIMRYEKDCGKEISAKFRQLLEILLNEQICFDLGDLLYMKSRIAIEDNSLKVGKKNYKTVVFGEKAECPLWLVDFLKKFCNVGGQVIFTDRDSYISAKQQIGLDNNLFFVSNSSASLHKFFSAINYQRPILFKNSDGTCSDSLYVSCSSKLNRAMVCNNGFDTKELTLFIPKKVNVSYYDLNQKKMIGIPSNFVSNYGTQAEITLEGKSFLLLSFEQNYEICKPKVVLRKLCKFNTVKTCEKNTLTLDRARYSIDGAQKTELSDVILTHDDIYDAALQKETSNCTVVYEYEFFCKEGVSDKDFSVCVEDEEIENLTINGHRLTDRNGYYLDRAIGEYSISGLTVTGKNTVTIEYLINNNHKKENVDEVFETERNRFFYEKEPESIYIRGNFDVVSSNFVESSKSGYAVSEPFEIAVPTNKNPNLDLTLQGLWFYCGNAEYSTTYDYSGGKVDLIAEKFKGTTIQIFVNGIEVATCVANPIRIELEQYLQKGFNSIKLILVGNNRNLFGPHHHTKGELNFVGVDSFKGKYSWTDFVSPELNENSQIHTDQYHFSKFNCGNIWFEEYEE